jgi:prolyl 4-hydroxylase
MLGSSTGMGQCRAACKDCHPCKPGNFSCYMDNRNSAGYLVVEENEMENWGQGNMKMMKDKF